VSRHQRPIKVTVVENRDDHGEIASTRATVDGPAGTYQCQVARGARVAEPRAYAVADAVAGYRDMMKAAREREPWR
jgi:hypothetical protein